MPRREGLTQNRKRSLEALLDPQDEVERGILPDSESARSQNTALDSNMKSQMQEVYNQFNDLQSKVEALGIVPPPR